MTEGGVSKKTFFGVVIGQQLANMAIAETDPEYRVYYFFGLLFLIPLFWVFQATMDYLKDIKNAQDIDNNP